MLRDEHRAFGRSHLRVVGDEQELDAVVERGLRTDAAHRRGHSPFGISIEALFGGGGINYARDSYDPLTGNFYTCANNFLTASENASPTDWHWLTVTSRTSMALDHRRVQVALTTISASRKPPSPSGEDLPRLARDLLLFLGNERNDVVDDVECHHSG